MAEADGTPQKRGSAALQIMVATAIGGGAGYLITIFAGVQLGAVNYASFAVFWSGLYLLISALTGVQQEVSRATHPAAEVPGASGRPVARTFALIAAAVVGGLTLATAPVWAAQVFPDDEWGLVLPLAAGVCAYVFVAVLTGVLYGLSLWRWIAVMISVDGLLRLILTGVLLLVTDDMKMLAWAIVLPFALTPLLLWFFLRADVVGRFAQDVAFNRLSWNVARTVLGAAATGVLVSGFPLLLGATSAHEPTADVSPLMFAINLARAPIIIVVMSLQSYFVIYFRSRLGDLGRNVLFLLALVLAATVVITLLAAWMGPWALQTFFGEDFFVSAPVIAAIVGSGGLVGAMCVTGPAVLSRSQHGMYTAGWVVAALVSLGALLLPLDLEARTILAVCAGPICGLIVHGIALVRRPARAMNPTNEPHPL